MIYKTPLTDILENAVSQMAFPISFTSVIIGDGVFTLTGVCNFQHLQVGYPMPINVNDDEDSIEYYIKDIDKDAKTITFKGALPDGITELPAGQEAYPVYFRHGTPKAANEELVKESVIFKKTPLIWLLDEFEEEFDDDDGSLIERESKIRLFFLTNADHGEVTNDITDHAVKPMYRLAQNFVKQLNRMPSVFNMYDDNGKKIKHKLIVHTKFGIYIANKGADKSILTGTFTGVEMPITLRIFKGDTCDEECEEDETFAIVQENGNDILVE